jgi:predicted transcriptional regulator
MTEGVAMADGPTAADGVAMADGPPSGDGSIGADGAGASGAPADGSIGADGAGASGAPADGSIGAGGAGASGAPADGSIGAGGGEGGPERNGTEVSRFVERFAAVLTEAGIPRMPARVFAALLATDSGRLTAAELAAQLQASPAAVSGGVRYLMGVGMIHREGEPGSRRHHYRVPDHVWDEVVSGRDRLMARWTAVLREGVALLGAGTPAGARLAESVEYFEFVSAELPRVVARWREHKAARDAQAAADR